MFAAALKMHRECLGWSQAEAARKVAEIPTRTWEDWEAERRAPADWVQRLILRALKSSH